MNTALMLAAQYDGQTIIPIDRVRKDYFSHLTAWRFSAKLQSGEIPLPVVRLDPGSQKTMRGVSIEDLASWIDQRKAAARKELQQITGT